MTNSSPLSDRGAGHTAGRRLIALTLVANVTLLTLVLRVARDPSWHAHAFTGNVIYVVNAALLVTAVVSLGLTIRRRPERVSGWLFVAVLVPVAVTVADVLIAWEMTYQGCEP